MADPMRVNLQLPPGTRAAIVEPAAADVRPSQAMGRPVAAGAVIAQDHAPHGPIGAEAGRRVARPDYPRPAPPPHHGTMPLPQEPAP